MLGALALIVNEEPRLQLHNDIRRRDSPDGWIAKTGGNQTGAPDHLVDATGGRSSDRRQNGPQPVRSCPDVLTNTARHHPAWPAPLVRHAFPAGR